MSWFSAQKRTRAQFEPVPKNALSANNSERFKINTKPVLNVGYTRTNYKPTRNPLVNLSYVPLTKQGSFFKVSRKTRKRKSRQCKQTRRS